MDITHIDWQTAAYAAGALLGFTCWTIMVYVMGYRKGVADVEACEEEVEKQVGQ